MFLWVGVILPELIQLVRVSFTMIENTVTMDTMMLLWILCLSRKLMVKNYIIQRG